MADYIISCCSTADVSASHLGKRGVKWLSFHYNLDGDDCADDLWQSMSSSSFYAAMVNGAETKTSQVTLGEYVKFFTEYAQQGIDILHISFSSGLSGSCASAVMAAEQVNKEFPKVRIAVVDSLAASSGYGLLVDKAADLRDQGLTLEENRAWLEANKLRLHHWFFSTDLTFYVKGGRVSKTAGLVGGALHICPLLNVDVNGKLAPREKIRTKKKAIHEAFSRMVEHAEGGKDYSGKVFISNSACSADASELAHLIEEHFTHMNGVVEHFSIGPTIGSHTGPGTVALFFWGDERVD